MVILKRFPSAFLFLNFSFGQGKKEVEALRLKFDHERWFHFTYESFKSLSNLRFLQVDSSREYSDVETRPCWNESPNVFLENSSILPQLRWLSWHYIPPTFKITNFSMEDVVILDLSWSKITHEWQGWSHMKVMKNLKVLKLKYCAFLERTPNFSAQLNLKRLILSGCVSLVEIDESIYQLKHLVSLRVDGCGKLQRLPQVVLRDLATLQHCNSSERLSDTIGNLESLIELDASRTKIEELPDSIGKWKNLKVMKIGSAMRNVPNALWMIKSLEEIEVNVWSSIDVEIGDCIYENQCLRSLHLTFVRINKVPRLPKSLEILRLNRIYMDTFPDLSNLVNLKKLDLGFGRRNDGGPVQVYPMPRWIEKLSKLESLVLRSDYVTTLPTLPTDMSSLLPRLSNLSLQRCPNLRCLPSLPSSLSYLELSGCRSLSSLGDLSNLKELSSLSIDDCAISEIRCRDPLENLRRLWLCDLRQLETLPSLGNFNKLHSLIVKKCGNLVEIRGELPQSLRRLEIIECGSLKELPDLSRLKELKKVRIKCCGNLDVEAISSLCLEKSVDFREEDDEFGLSRIWGIR